MYQWEAGEPRPGSSHPHRLWLDIWSQSRWNVRRVMMGMVIGRLWLTFDLEVLKGHRSLNHLWADVFSDHEKVTESNKNPRKVSSRQHFRAVFFFFSKFGFIKCVKPSVVLMTTLYHPNISDLLLSFKRGLICCNAVEMPLVSAEIIHPSVFY